MDKSLEVRNRAGYHPVGSVALAMGAKQIKDLVGVSDRFDPNGSLSSLYVFDDGSMIAEHLGQAGAPIYDFLDKGEGAELIREMRQVADAGKHDMAQRELFGGQYERFEQAVSELPASQLDNWRSDRQKRKMPTPA